MRCLITGYKGYIGSAMFSTLQKLNYEVRGIDLKEGKCITKDLYELDSFKPDFIFHMAAFPRVGYSIENPSETLYHNVYGTSKILEYAVKNKTRRVIFSSSSAIYGDDGNITNPYGLQKQLSESECKLYRDLYNLDVVCLRYFNVYSKEQPTDGSYSTVIAAWQEKIKMKEEPIINGDGTIKRDFIHLNDIININLFCMKKEKFRNIYYDVGTGRSVSLNYLAKKIKKINPNINFIYGEKRLGDAKQTKANIKPLEAEGWKSLIDIDRGLEECFGRFR